METLTDPLTDREQMVLQLMADGLTGLEIAGHLGIALATVKTHRKKVVSKLGAYTSAHAVALGLRGGLIRHRPSRRPHPGPHPVASPPGP